MRPFPAQLSASLACLLLARGAGWAAAAEHLVLYAGQSRLLEAPGLQRLLAGNPSVLQARLLDGDQLLLNGKAPGQSSLLAWERNGRQRAWEVEVLAAGLKRSLVELDVQVLEIAEGSGWDAGVDWAGALAGPAPAAAGLPASPLQVLERAPPPLLAFGSFQRGPLSLRLEALLKENKARLLAKPRLVTVSGGRARFLSGGQVPVVSSDRDGRPATQYKDYGVSLDVEPKDDGEGNVHAQVRAELSDIDAANSVSLPGGGLLPAIKTRWVETGVWVRRDSTLVLAGLLLQSKGEVVQGLPVLSLIPLLGELFKHRSATLRSSELVIFLTPRVLP